MDYEAFRSMIPLMSIVPVLGFVTASLILKRGRKSAMSIQGLGDRDKKPGQAIMAGISAALLAAGAHAASDTRFVVAAYSNIAGGQQIISGDYKAALTALETESSAEGVDVASLSVNRCAALTMAKQWSAAQTACDQAVQYARLAKITDAQGSLQQLNLLDEKLAVAYSDRAVLEWLTNKAKVAAQDMAHARAVQPHSRLVAQNVMALGMHSTVVDVRSTEQR